MSLVYASPAFLSELAGRNRRGAGAAAGGCDPATVKSKTPRFVSDLPGGARRLVADAEGVAATIVAGRIVCRDGEYTGERAGRVLRSGRC